MPSKPDKEKRHRDTLLLNAGARCRLLPKPGINLSRERRILMVFFLQGGQVLAAAVGWIETSKESRVGSCCLRRVEAGKAYCGSWYRSYQSWHVSTRLFICLYLSVPLLSRFLLILQNGLSGFVSQPYFSRRRSRDRASVTWLNRLYAVSRTTGWLRSLRVRRSTRKLSC